METETKTLLEIKKDALIRAMAVAGGNRTKAAEILGVSIRSIRNWILEFGLSEIFPARVGGYFPPRKSVKNG